jgi:hypothetical protein
MTPETIQRLRDVVREFQALGLVVKAETNDVVNASTANLDHVSMVKHFNSLRIANELIKGAREMLTDVADELSKRDIPDLFAMLRDKTGQKPPFVIEFSEGNAGRVSVSHRFSCSMIDKDQGIKWLKTNGHEGLVQETVNAQTLAGFAKNLLEDKGEELPPDLFKVGTSPYTSITKV